MYLLYLLASQPVPYDESSSAFTHVESYDDLGYSASQGSSSVEIVFDENYTQGSQYNKSSQLKSDNFSKFLTKLEKY